MTIWRFANFIKTELAADVAYNDTTIQVPPSDAAQMPIIIPGDEMFPLTLWDGTSTAPEIVHVTANDGLGTLTVTRAAESSNHSVWAAGTEVRLALTNQSIQDTVLAAVSLASTVADMQLAVAQKSDIGHLHVIADMPELGDFIATLSDLAVSGNWTDVQSKPTTIAGYGILDAATAGQFTGGIRDAAGAVTLALADMSKMVRTTENTNITLTIPPNVSVAFPVGTFIWFIQGGTGVATVTAGAGVTLLSRGTRIKTAGQYAIGYVVQLSANVWACNGDLTT